MSRRNMRDSMIIGKIFMITGFVLATLCLTTAEASISETIEYSVERTNEFFPLEESLSIPIDISVEITGEIEVTGPGGYTWTQSISGPGSDTYSRTLGPAGTYTVAESYEVRITGSVGGMFALLIEPVTETYSFSASPWTFSAAASDAAGELEVTSDFGNLIISKHSDNISVSISGLLVTITTKPPINVGDTISATASGQVTVDTDMTLSGAPSGGTTPPAGTGGGMDVDIAISTQANWISQEAADREMNEVVNNVMSSVNDVRVFTRDDESSLADWVTSHTNNSQLDVLILCGVIPDSIYPSGNQQPDGSIAEEFLEAGNMIINTADYIFWIPANFGAGLQNMMDLPDVTMWYGGDMVVTSLGQQYLPSLNPYLTYRALSLDTLAPPWNVEAVFAQNSEGTLAEPVVVRDSTTGGRLVIFYQVTNDDLPRGEVISEFILNWLPTVVGGSAIPPDGGTPDEPPDATGEQIVIDFEDGDLGDWQIVDDVNTSEGPASWSIRDSEWGLDGKALYQGSNIWSNTGGTCIAGTFLIYTGQQFTNFTIDVDIAASDNDGIGLVWAYTGTDRHYRTIMLNDGWPRSPADGIKGPFIKMAKRIGNVAPFYELLSAAKDNYVKYPYREKFHLTLEVNNGVFTVTRDDGLTLSATDSSYRTGYVGIQLYAQQGVEFDNFTITPLDDGYIPPDDDTTPPPEPGEFVLVGTDPDDALWANIDQVFVSNDADKITFQVTSHGQWADDIYFSIEMDTDQNRNTGDPEDGVDHLVVVSMDDTTLSGGVFAYNSYQDEFIFTDATLYDVICVSDSDLFQVSALLDDIGNPNAIDFEVWMALVDLADVAPDIGLYTYVLGETQTPDTPTARTLSITSAEASPGFSATVYLSISDAADIAGGDVEITYDPGVIMVGEVTGASLISGMNLMVNVNVPGKISIGMAGTTGIPSGSGHLVNIPLTVSASAQAGTQTTLQITDAEMYSESGATIPVSSQSGVVRIIQGALKGDVNGDGRVRSNDAILALRIATGLMTPNSDQQWAADMNSDGRVRSNDAILILREAAGMAAPEKGFIASVGRPISVALTEAHGVAGEGIAVPLKVDDIAGLAGGDIRIAYDSTVLRAIDVLSDPDVLLASNVSEPGIVNIAFAGTTELSSQTLAQIQFQILADDVSPLKFQQVDLYNSSALPLNARCIDEQFISWAVPPKHSALLQNFPNPFNPETWIPYQLKDGSEVTIQIHSAGGELVRKLDLGYKAPGLYVSRDRAAYWDGKNTSGERVASGVYFYSMQAGEFATVRKLIVLK